MNSTQDEALPPVEELLSAAMQRINEASDVSDAEQVRVQFLGKKGPLTAHLKRIGQLPPEERRGHGQLINKAKRQIEALLKERMLTLESTAMEQALSSELVDVSLPGRRQSPGGPHPITRSAERIERIFGRLGFDVASGPELEDDYHNFQALNIPVNHPARAMQDTFYVDEQMLLRTHTSPVQIRYMETNEPPLRVIAPGRVYRVDSDVTHTPMFHQVEGLAVDVDVTMADLKGVLTHFVREFFEADANLRFRPSYFPFTEPSAEVDMSCIFCAQKGCRICGQTGWVEVLGCGMVHPNVLTNVGIDSETYTGYAFGMGIERMTMLRYGIDDLRILFDNDLELLSQFG